MTSRLEILPAEILQQCLPTDHKSRNSLRLVSKRIAAAADDQLAWRDMLVRDFPSAASCPPAIARPFYGFLFSWKRELAALTPSQLRVVNLYLNQNCGRGEIAQRMFPGIDPRGPRVRQAVHRALKKGNEALERTNWSSLISVVQELDPLQQDEAVAFQDAVSKHSALRLLRTWHHART